MNQYLFLHSESLVLSLTQEIEYIKSRSRNINYSLKSCQNKTLSTILKSELTKLNNKRLNILHIAESMFNRNCNDLSLEFLLEITKRSNSFQQI